MPRSTTKGLAAALAIAATAVPLTACGGSSRSDKPAYCDKRDALSGDVQKLKDLSLKSDGLQALRTQLDQIRSDARAVVTSAKSDFPSEIADMQRSLDNLKTTVKNTSSSPSAQDLVFLGTGVSSLVGSASAFVDAAGDKCCPSPRDRSRVARHGGRRRLQRGAPAGEHR